MLSEKDMEREIERRNDQRSKDQERRHKQEIEDKKSEAEFWQKYKEMRSKGI